MDDQARAQHYLFAHRMMPTIFFQDPDKFLATLNEHGMPFLRFLWDRVGQGLDAEHVLSGQGLDYQTRGYEDGTRITVITLPAAERVTEAHFIAPVYRPPAPDHAAVVRYFTLEYGTSLFSDGARTVLCEWTADSSHLNYGDGPQPTADAFTAAVSGKLMGKE